MTWEVQTLTLCDGWVNTWTISRFGQAEQPETFASFVEAEQALARFIEDARFAVEAGDLTDPPDPSEYRITGYD
ncbi:hypothetical protein [Sphingopyxis sp. EG6]|uniref:hypothetical protein n=1 Tax=Sphingopyxis sp. EG6 TaxID=1874061 RepID=UPI000DC63EFA|nr:hypothetical protein [Sphingopyxis sp. EG6]BBB10732.1 hypothetical protein SPYCW_3748 [Sphingopyxis sp. EG6]